jgi:hypothetical protein
VSFLPSTFKYQCTLLGSTVNSVISSNAEMNASFWYRYGGNNHSVLSIQYMLLLLLLTRRILPPHTMTIW